MLTPAIVSATWVYHCSQKKANYDVYLELTLLFFEYFIVCIINIQLCFTKGLKSWMGNHNLSRPVSRAVEKSWVTAIEAVGPNHTHLDPVSEKSMVLKYRNPERVGDLMTSIQHCFPSGTFESTNINLAISFLKSALYQWFSTFLTTNPLLSTTMFEGAMTVQLLPV